MSCRSGSPSRNCSSSASRRPSSAASRTSLRRVRGVLERVSAAARPRVLLPRAVHRAAELPIGRSPPPTWPFSRVAEPQFSPACDQRRDPPRPRPRRDPGPTVDQPASRLDRACSISSEDLSERSFVRILLELHRRPVEVFEGSFRKPMPDCEVLPGGPRSSPARVLKLGEQSRLLLKRKLARLDLATQGREDEVVRHIRERDNSATGGRRRRLSVDEAAVRAPRQSPDPAVCRRSPRAPSPACRSVRPFVSQTAPRWRSAANCSEVVADAPA